MKESRGGRWEYGVSKREYKEMCKKKKEEESDKWERETKKAKAENEVWIIVNWKRRRRVTGNENLYYSHNIQEVSRIFIF